VVLAGGPGDLLLDEGMDSTGWAKVQLGEKSGINEGEGGT